MVAEVKMPALSPTMTEGKIVSWVKKEGETIAVGDVLLEVETDKAVMEVEAQSKGILGKVLAGADNTIAVGKTIALILEKGETADALKDFKITDDSNSKDDSAKENNNKDVKEEKNDQNNIVDDNNSVNAVVLQNNSISKHDDQRIFASPLAKKIATLNNISIEQISTGTGPNGRIIKADVEKFLSSTPTNLMCCSGRNFVEYVDTEPTGMRKTIANRLLESKQQNPHWYLKTSINMTNFIDFRQQINSMAKIIDGKPEFKVSANDIIVMAIAKALKKNKQINVSWINGKIRQYNNVDISVAVSVNGGLLTPIVKNADQMSLLDISANIKQLVVKAREGKLSPVDYSGGSISVSNLGMYGIEEFISIINPPQSCIVAVGAIEDRVLAIKGEVKVCPVCNLFFSADHRVIDGAVLAPFVNDIKMMLENPALMLMA